MPVEITNEQLRAEDLPPPAADWGPVGRFALTFNGYEYSDSVAQLADATRRAYDDALADFASMSLGDLRACLFYEQRRWRHFGYEPDPDAMRYIHALVEAIRDHLARRG